MSSEMLTDFPDFPSRGYFLSSTAVRCAPVPYLCMHDTNPPENQVLRNLDESEALLRMYTKRADAAARDRNPDTKGKRPMPPVADTHPSNPLKRVNTDVAGPSMRGPAQPLDSKAVYTHEQLKAKTNKELADILKSKLLPVTGRKDELIRRILDFQRRQKRASAPS